VLAVTLSKFNAMHMLQPLIVQKIVKKSYLAAINVRVDVSVNAERAKSK